MCVQHALLFVSTAWPSGRARRLQIVSGGFDSHLKPIAFDIGWLLTQRVQAHFAVSVNLLNFLFNEI